MRRIAFALMLSLGCTIAAGTVPALAQPHARMCPRGMHWVPRHRDHMGHWVRAHCVRN